MKLKRKKQERMSSFVVRASKAEASGNIPESHKLITQGLEYYSKRVVEAINPYATADAGLLVFVLRHIANEVEEKNVGAKELVAELDKIVIKPALQETQRTEKPNAK